MNTSQIRISLIFCLLVFFQTQFVFSQQAEPLQAGEAAPALKGQTHQGKTFDLGETTKSEPVIVLFYRGAWSESCISFLSDIQDSIEMISALGTSLIAISPERPFSVEKTVKKTDASFDIISDSNHKIMDDWKVSSKVSIARVRAYKVRNIVDLEKVHGNTKRTLPVTALYIVDSNGMIVYVYFDENHRNRPSVKEILDYLAETDL